MCCSPYNVDYCLQRKGNSWAYRKLLYRGLRIIYPLFLWGRYSGYNYERVFIKCFTGWLWANKIQSDISITTVLENESGDIIEITQTITDNTQHNLDNQNGDKYEISVDDQKIQVLESDSFIQSVWIKDMYCFKVTGYGNIDKEILKQVIENIE